jgi:hypothetical protein
VDEAGFLEVGAMAVDAAGRCFVADRRVPVVAEIDAADGRVVGRYTWPLDSGCRRLATTTALAMQGGDLLVASPAAGGVVRIDRSTGATTVTPLPLPPISLATGEDGVVWAVGFRELDESLPPVHDGTHHPVEWIEPTEDDRVRTHAELYELLGPDQAARAVAGPLPTAADWASDDDRADLVERSHELYRVSGDRLDRVDVGVVEGIDGVLVADTFVCVCWRGDDPLVKRVGIGGYLAYERPSSLLAVNDDGAVRRLGRVDDSEELVADGRRAWLLGNDRRDRATARPIDLGDGPGGVLELDVDEAVAVVAGHVVGVEHDRRLPWEREPGAAWRRGTTLAVHALRGGAPRRVVDLPRVGTDSPVIDGTSVWFAREDGTGLVAVDVGTAGVREVGVRVDCRPLLAPLHVPAGVDLDEFERSQAEALRAGLISPLVSDDGEHQRPVIRGVTVDSVELEGRFPTTSVVARFRADSHPGVGFGRRWRLYDELGEPIELEFADIELVEDVEAAGYGLPAPNDCVPDETGTVWF